MYNSEVFCTLKDSLGDISAKRETLALRASLNELNKEKKGSKSMCVAAAPAHFSQTIVYGGEITALDRPIHVVGYQNTFRNGNGNRPMFQSLGWREESHGNAMLLHFPAKPGTLTPSNILDTSGYSRLLEDMELAITPRMRGGMSNSFGVTRGVIPKVVVFDHGIYTIVLAQDGKYIVEALDQVPPEKKPPINEEVFGVYSDWYPEWPVALCCFNNGQVRKAEPMMWWYEPQRSDILFVPALDGHDGHRPRPGELVEVDHTVIFGSDRFQDGQGRPVYYTDHPNEALKHYLPKRVVGGMFHGATLPNGDFIASTAAVRAGSPEYKRELPPNR